MTLNQQTSLWARTALFWFVLTICFGMYLGMTEQFGLSSPHAHMGLLGWVSSALFAFLYSLTGGAARATAAAIHWAGHNAGVVLMVVGLFLTMRHGAGPLTVLIPIGGTLVVLATLWLAWMLWPRLRAG